MRVGNVVTVSGGVNIICNATTGTCSVSVTLPINTNATNDSNLCGVGYDTSLTNQQGVGIYYASGGARLTFENTLHNAILSFKTHYTYVVL